MAINQILSNSNPMVHTEIACTQDSINISIPTQPQEIDFCYCDFECQYEELKIVNPAESFGNDKSMFIDEVVDPTTGTILYSIYKNGVKVADIVDDTYGTYFALGSIPNSGVTDHSLKSATIIEWEKVYNAFGLGKYQIKTTVTNYTRPLTKESPIYNVKLFSERIADDTIVLKATQNGYIQGGMDYTGLEWEFEYRISGKLIEQTPEYVKRTFQTSDRAEQQIQAQTIRQYKLHLDFISDNISSMLIDDNIMANTISITDYNIWTHGLTYKEVFLTVEEFDTLESFPRSQKANLVIDMKVSKQDKLKRNFK